MKSALGTGRKRGAGKEPETSKSNVAEPRKNEQQNGRHTFKKSGKQSTERLSKTSVHRYCLDQLTAIYPTPDGESVECKKISEEICS